MADGRHHDTKEITRDVWSKADRTRREVITMHAVHHGILTIGDLVARYNVAPQSLRNWEKKGLIPPARRTPGGHRRYGAEHVAALDRVLIASSASTPWSAVVID